MGLHHVRCVAAARGLALAGACDTDPARAKPLSEGVPFTTDVDEAIESADAVVLAVPSDRHEELGKRILAAGRHLLVEKPLCVRADSCRELSREARRRGLVLSVGHVERMNGAWIGLSDRITTPRFVEGHRLAEFDPRGTEVDVVLDLMIHDLDLVLDLFGGPPAAVDAVGVAVLSDRIDIANARLEFGGGALVNLTASRVSQKPVRKLRIFQPDAYFSIDFRAQRTEIFSRRGGTGDAPRVSREIRAAPDGHNPLVRELEEFARAVRGEASAVTSAEEGTRAVELAGRILESIEIRRSAWAGASGDGGAPWIDAPS
jgi:predicted dehydrogenase